MGGRIIDPSQGLDKVGDLLVKDGVIKTDQQIQLSDGVRVIDATGLVV